MSKLIKFMVCVVATIFAVNVSAAEDTPKWVEVNLETPGNLGVEILYQADKLSDVTHLRLSGEINSTDWITIKNLSNIEVLDMENTITESVPASTFDGRKSLVSINFPKTLNTIGNYAFRGSSLDEVIFPVSLKTIGEYGFSITKIKNIKFAEGSKLKSLGAGVFSECESLMSVTFPLEAEITTISSSLFYNCKNLSSIVLPEKITEISEHAFKGTKNLSHIDLPGNLISIGQQAFYSSALERIVIPQYVSKIESSAFSQSKCLKEVELPTSLHSLGSVFGDCPDIEKVICKSPTPPSTGGRRFPKSITLVVPDFAVPEYKLDPNWLGYDSIVGGAKSDYWDIAGAVSFTNDRRPDGTPSITVRQDGSLNVSGTSAMTVDEFKMDFNQNYQTQSDYHLPLFINASPLMSANKAEVSYSMRSGYWYYLALPFDVKVDDITHSDPTAEFAVRYYDGAERASANKTGNSWKDVPAGTVIKAGTGFIFQMNKYGKMTFPCADDGRSTIFNPNSVNMELAANQAESAAHSGWNFVANPYPCYYDMYYSMLSCPITVYNPGNGSYYAYSLIDDDVVLWPNRPFFIQATDDVKEIVFSNRGRQMTSAVNRRAEAPSKSKASGSRALFNISLSCGGVTDATRVVINPEATEEYEISRDASKFLSDNAEAPQIYTIAANGEYLAINERDQANGVVRMGFFAPAAGEMSLVMPRIDGYATLHDTLTGTITELTEGEEYKFTVSAPGFYNTRFNLVLIAPGMTGVNTIHDERPAGIAADGNIIRVSNVCGKEVIITSADGKVLVGETAGADIMEYSMPCGLYIVKAGASTSKCFIK